MRLQRIRRAACALLVLAATATGVQAAYGWTGTLYFNSTASPGNPEYTPGWAYRVRQPDGHRHRLRARSRSGR